MSTPIKQIRERLGLTQAELGDVIGKSQGSVWLYEREVDPKTIPPSAAKRLIAYAKSRRVKVTLDDLYAAEPA